MAASIDHTDSVGQKTTGAREYAAKGLEEQWLKELEQAHTQKQMSAIHSTAMLYDAAADEISAGHAPDQGDGFPGADVQAVFGDVPANRTTTQYIENGSTEGKAIREARVPCEPVNDAASEPYPAANTTNRLFKYSSGSIDSNMCAEVSRPTDMRAVRGLLPPSSMLTAIDADDGIHIVIRDMSLEASDVMRVVEKMREAVTLRKRRLSAVTLNGQCLWRSNPATHSNRPASDRIPRKRIDRIY